MTTRGITWTEEHRHACEVRYVAAMPTRQQRADYLEAIDKRRGQAAGDALRAGLREMWAARKAPLPPGERPRPASVASVHPAVNAGQGAGTPVSGSFLAAPHGGDSDPVACVDSGVAA